MDPRFQSTRGAYYTMPDGNIIALREPVMPNGPLTANPLKTGKYVLNVESVGLIPEQFTLDLTQVWQ